MKFFLAIASRIDALNERVGRTVFWLVLITVLICAMNAIVRKLFNVSSNAFLEIQWYLFAAVFLLAAGYTLKHDAHVRIDVIFGKLSVRGQALINVVGSLFFLLPLAVLMVWHGWPIFAGSFASAEMSADAGGLLRWPVKLLVPLGFALLGLQAIAEVIKNLAVLTGNRAPSPAETTMVDH